MDLEPQKKQQTDLKSKSTSRIQEKEEEEVTEGMTERDHKSDDLKDSPLKIFMSTEVFLLLAGLVIGAIYYFFFRGL